MQPPSKEDIDAAFEGMERGDVSLARRVLNLAPEVQIRRPRLFVGKSKPSKAKRTKRKKAKAARRKNR